MVRRGKRLIESAVPPAGSIYIASCRLSRPFRRRFRGKDASVTAFSDPAIVMPVAYLLDYVMSAHSCYSRIGSSRSGEATTYRDSQAPSRRAAAGRLGRKGSKAGNIVGACQGNGLGGG